VFGQHSTFSFDKAGCFIHKIYVAFYLFMESDMKKIIFAATAALAVASAGEIFADGEGGDSAAYEGDSLGGIFFGAGGGYAFCSKDTAKSLGTGHEVSKSNDRFMGTIIFGSGKSMSAYRIYLGGEVLVDFAKTKRADQKLDGVDVKMRNNGIAPSLGFRIGIPGSAACTLFFLRGGVTYAKSMLEYTDWKLTNAKFAPFFGFGAEKMFGGKISLRGDLEYRCENNKSNDTYKLVRGHTVNSRVLVVYHVKY
jgi:hypothetical protein